jgi:membrane protein DedA with SNARE-associated domain
MDSVLALVLQYGYVLLFAFVAAEQVGLPIPAVPVLLSVGALAGTGRMSIGLALGIAIAASLPPDLVWYELGRRRGGRVLGFICRLSLEPDSCVRSTENLFQRRGPGALLIAKFLPGLSTLAPPLAGIVGIPRPRFLLLDVGGALAWAGAWLALGYAFRGALDTVLTLAGRFGHGALLLAVSALAGWVGGKFIRRRAFLRRHRMARISADELKRRLDAGDVSVVVIDTRSALDVGITPFVIPGALRIPADEIDRRHAEVPRERDVVLYCT